MSPFPHADLENSKRKRRGGGDRGRCSWTWGLRLSFLMRKIKLTRIRTTAGTMQKSSIKNQMTMSTIQTNTSRRGTIRAQIQGCPVISSRIL
jgi:hypothetical protein